MEGHVHKKEAVEKIRRRRWRRKETAHKKLSENGQSCLSGLTLTAGALSSQTCRLNPTHPQPPRHRLSPPPLSRGGLCPSNTQNLKLLDRATCKFNQTKISPFGSHSISKFLDQICTILRDFIRTSRITVLYLASQLKTAAVKVRISLSILMGGGEQSSPAKHSKPTSIQETPPPQYPDWSQACYSSGYAPPPYPYMWGAQHPMMPPYGTPVPYPSMYPPPGVYGHPNMPMTPSQPNQEMETKASNGKDSGQNKKSKGNLGNVVRSGDSGKAGSSSGNDGATQSGESGNDGSSDGTDDDDRQEYSGGKKGSFQQILADANARNNNSNSNIQNPVASMPPTNLNMGMDLWNPSTGSIPQTVAPPPMVPNQWAQDERELKRQKRKQSNRESARRSRLRKQAECEELQAKVEALSNENHSLRDELQRLSEECGNLTSENNSIMDELTKFFGPEVVSKLDEQLQS
ncbi:hypothetical protein LXL04_007120 [Taraxacum kok-saghyz]